MARLARKLLLIAASSSPPAPCEQREQHLHLVVRLKR
jgi:hypothetical protein